MICINCKHETMHAKTIYIVEIKNITEMVVKEVRHGYCEMTGCTCNNFKTIAEQMVQDIQAREDGGRK